MSSPESNNFIKPIANNEHLSSPHWHINRVKLGRGDLCVCRDLL